MPYKGLSNSRRNGLAYNIKMVKVETKSTHKPKKRKEDYADVCLQCTDKKCSGTIECMEKHRRKLDGERKEDMG